MRESPVRPERAMDHFDAEYLADVLRPLAEPAALRMVSIVAGQPGTCVKDLAGPLNLCQGTISHHVGQLRRVGVMLEGRDRIGVRVPLRLDLGVLAGIADDLRDVFVAGVR